MKSSMLELGGGYRTPLLKIFEWMKVLVLHDRLPILWGSSGSAAEVLPKFWRRYRQHEGSHAVYTDHRARLNQVIPLQLHADEGQTLKKSACMIWSFHSPLGTGTSKQPKTYDLNLNYKGSTYATRFLLSICVKKVYKKAAERLDVVMAAIVEDLRELYFHGVEVVIQGVNIRFFAACSGFLGDWPVQAKFGHLTRHFARKGVFQLTSKSGICHLCRAGEVNLPPHDFSTTAAWRATYLTTAPWNEEGPLCALPQSRRKELIHRFDAFHTLHKGCFAELAGSGLDSRLCFTKCLLNSFISLYRL